MITFVLGAVLSVLAVEVLIDFLLHPSLDVLVCIAAIAIEAIGEAFTQGRRN
jgi:hypothetical protein